MKGLVFVFSILLFVGCTGNHTAILQGYIEGEYTLLAPNIAGRLQKLYVQRGDIVRKGQHLFDLDPEPEAAQLRKAQFTLQSEQSKLKDYLSGQRSTVLAGIIAQREQAQADLDLAKNNFNRTSELYQKGVVSKANYDEALASLKLNEQKVNQYEQNLREAELGEREYRILEQTEQVKGAEAAVQEAQWRINQKSLSAPEEGFIFDTFFNEGEQIAANQPVISLLAPRYIRVIFYVPEPIRALLSINEQVKFTCDNCGQHYVARINYISPQAEYTPPVIFSRESRIKLMYRVQALLPTAVAKKLHPGQPVDVYIIYRTSTRPLMNRIWQWLKK